MRALTTLFIGALLLMIGCANTPRTEEAVAWDYACTKFDCRGVPVPIVVTAEWLYDYGEAGYGAWGFYYDGDPYVYVDPDLEPELRTVVTVHEMVHYLQWVTTGENAPSCDREAEAWSVGDDYALLIGRDDLVHGETWWVPYPRCQGYPNVYSTYGLLF